MEKQKVAGEREEEREINITEKRKEKNYNMGSSLPTSFKEKVEGAV
jgi:hypothetical protein